MSTADTRDANRKSHLLVKAGLSLAAFLGLALVGLQVGGLLGALCLGASVYAGFKAHNFTYGAEAAEHRIEERAAFAPLRKSAPAPVAPVLNEAPPLPPAPAVKSWVQTVEERAVPAAGRDAA